jgi:hypothetical protein
MLPLRGAMCVFSVVTMCIPSPADQPCSLGVLPGKTEEKWISVLFSRGNLKTLIVAG